MRSSHAKLVLQMPVIWFSFVVATIQLKGLMLIEKKEKKRKRGKKFLTPSGQRPYVLVCNTNDIVIEGHPTTVFSQIL